MRKVISLITDKGLEFFEQVDTEELENLKEGTHIFLQTEDEKEHLGIYTGFSRNHQNLLLKAADDSLIMHLSLERIKVFFKEKKSEA